MFYVFTVKGADACVHYDGETITNMANGLQVKMNESQFTNFILSNADPGTITAQNYYKQQIKK